MAAAIQTHVRKFEEKLKPYLHQGPLAPYWTLLEQKTKLKREQLALGLCGIIAIYLAFGWANDFICNLIGFLYPAYASVLAVESKSTRDDTEWLVYWIVYCSFGFVEYFGHDFFHTLPFYWLLKCVFLFWLMTPGVNGGSQLLYQRLIRPFVLKHQSTVERHMRDAKDQVKKFTNIDKN